jgi:deoxyhypusine synthase
MRCAQDIRGINGMAMRAKHSGAVILGGGVVKHHIMNANLMRNGTDHCVYINTGQEVVTKESLPIVILAFDPRMRWFAFCNAVFQFDGSDSGARPDEAVSWGKIRLNTKGVKVCAKRAAVEKPSFSFVSKVYGEATLTFPLLVAETFAKYHHQQTAASSTGGSTASAEK